MYRVVKTLIITTLPTIVAAAIVKKVIVLTESIPSLNAGLTANRQLLATDGFITCKRSNLQYGEVARAFFYFFTRYQDNIIGWSNNSKAFSKDTFPPLLQFFI